MIKSTLKTASLSLTLSPHSFSHVFNLPLGAYQRENISPTFLHTLHPSAGLEIDNKEFIYAHRN